MPCKVQILGESKKYKKNLNLIGVLWEPFEGLPQITSPGMLIGFRAVFFVVQFL